MDSLLYQHSRALATLVKSSAGCALSKKELWQKDPIEVLSKCIPCTVKEGKLIFFCNFRICTGKDS